MAISVNVQYKRGCCQIHISKVNDLQNGIKNDIHYTVPTVILGWLAVSLALTELIKYLTVYFQFLTLGGTTPKCELNQHPAHQNSTNTAANIL